MDINQSPNGPLSLMTARCGYIIRVQKTLDEKNKLLHKNSVIHFSIMKVTRKAVLFLNLWNCENTYCKFRHFIIFSLKRVTT